MDLATLSIAALIVAILISAIRSDLNTGVIAVSFAFLIGVGLAGLSFAKVAAFLPAQLVLMLVGISLLFGMARDNGTMDWLSGLAMRAAGNRPALLPIAFFIFTFALAAIGPGNIAAVAVIAPIGMALCTRAGVSPLLMAIMICTGANAGAFSPVAPTGIINLDLMHKIGVADRGVPMQVFLAAAALQSATALAAYGLFRGYRVQRGGSLALALSAPRITMPGRDVAWTLVAIGALLASVLLFNAPAGAAAFVIAALLALFRAGDMERGLAHVPWSVIALVGGVSILIGLIEALDGTELATTWLAQVASPATINGALGLLTGAVSAVSSSSGVVMPMFLPLLPGLMAKLGGGDLISMVIAVDVGSHLVDVSPLSSLGALCIAAVDASVDKQRLFRRLLAWGLLMALVGAVLAHVFLDVL